jgi:flavin reductase (DIM6/NTAB) family NADH-FMN oxidoreductase RutF/DNA-binding IclR family transcriptional regulator
MTTSVDGLIDPREYRTVLGNYPTGVVAVTAVQADGTPAAMTVGSFTSASLDPPLIAFLPDKSSSSFPKIREAGSFCVNVLSNEQESVCRSFAAKGTDKFAGVAWRPAPSGAPIIDDIVAWMDCDIEQVLDVGDHYLVVGHIRAMGAPGSALPLLFFQGGYGEFSSPWKTARATPEMLPLLRVADAARGELVPLAADLGVECLLSAVDGDDMRLLAGASRSDRRLVNTLGQRIPLLPPIGIPLVAWRETAEIDRWTASVGADADVAAIRELVARVRERGWSVALASPEQIALEAAVASLTASQRTPEDDRLLRERIEKLLVAGSYEPEALDPAASYRVRHLSVPLHGTPERPAMSVSLYGLPAALRGEEIPRFVEPLQQAVARIQARIA